MYQNKNFKTLKLLNFKTFPNFSKLFQTFPNFFFFSKKEN